MLRHLAILILCASLVNSPRTAAASSDGRHGSSRHITNIVFSGLAGAILGLSTLSFYGRPQDRLNNIGVGFALGVITGTLITTYKAASEPRDFYGLRQQPEPSALNDDPRFQPPDGVKLVDYRLTF